eukprot:3758447-Rhodomonas_salina.1
MYCGRRTPSSGPPHSFKSGRKEREQRGESGAGENENKRRRRDDAAEDGREETEREKDFGLNLREHQTSDGGGSSQRRSEEGTEQQTRKGKRDRARSGAESGGLETLFLLSLLQNSCSTREKREERKRSASEPIRCFLPSIRPNPRAS